MNTTELPDVLTLEETASYLRVPQDAVERVATKGQLPGRRIDYSWRFLRDAIDEWLRSSDSRSVLLQQSGALADDDSIPELLANIYANRGRPITDEVVDV